MYRYCPYHTLQVYMLWYMPMRGASEWLQKREMGTVESNLHSSTLRFRWTAMIMWSLNKLIYSVLLYTIGQMFIAGPPARPRRVWIEMERNISRNWYHFEGCYSYRRMWTRKIACGGSLIKYLLQLSIEYMSITIILSKLQLNIDLNN